MAKQTDKKTVEEVLSDMTPEDQERMASDVRSVLKAMSSKEEERLRKKFGIVGSEVRG